MKWLIALLFFSTLFFSCNKETFITSTDARLSVSADTLKFDTVFTSVGSVTQLFKISNSNNQKLRLTAIQLAGGGTSSYQLNINGVATNNATNLEIDANDSIYVFAKVTINPNAAKLPFIVSDSIKIVYNGNTKWVQLQAFGQNARFLRNQKITTNTTWNNLLPYVILGGITVDTFATLTIDKGTKIYANANAPIVIHGSLKVNGQKDAIDRVYFNGDRLDAEYKDLPGGWPGIIFSNASQANMLNFAVIKNAYQAIVTVGGAANATPKLTLNECSIDNAYDVGLYAINSSVNSRNCLITNCGNEATLGIGGSNVLVSGGGNYAFNHATITTFANLFNLHKQPVVFLSNAYNGSTAVLNANFTNCIIYGESGLVEDEIKTDKQGAASFNVVLNNVLFKAKNDPTATIVASIKNQNPLFDSINTNRRTYNFHLRDGSAAINTGMVIGGIGIDLDGKPRLVGTKPDLGCYEKQ